MEKMILAEYADMKEEIKDLRKRIQKLEREIGKLEDSIVTDSVSCGKKGKKSLGTVKISGVPDGILHWMPDVPCYRSVKQNFWS